MVSDEVKYWVAFCRIPTIGRARFALPEGHFRSLGEAGRAVGSELAAVGLDQRSVKAILSRGPAVSPEAEVERQVRLEIDAITIRDARFPRLLGEIYEYPPVLYVKCESFPEDERSVTVVGTRKTTPYGREVAHQIAVDLVSSGVTIVSGLARGIEPWYTGLPWRLEGARWMCWLMAWIWCILQNTPK